MTEGIAAEQLRSFVERIERLNEEDDALKADKREVFAEAKAMGFCPKTMRRVIRARKQKADNADDYVEGEHMFDLYMTALGTDRATRATRARDHQDPADTPQPESAELAGDGAGDSTTTLSPAGESPAAETPPSNAAGEEQGGDGSPQTNPVVDPDSGEEHEHAAEDPKQEGQAPPEATGDGACSPQRGLDGDPPDFLRREVAAQ